jgi:MscS family membrane protein
MDVVKEAGTGLAIPAQTTYLARDQTLNAEQGRAAEAEVEAWRKTGELPFPWVSPERRAQVTDTLPYPPPGTPTGPRVTEVPVRTKTAKGGAQKKG